ncbi:MAG: flagellin [Pseudomonadota bacterium]
MTSILTNQGAMVALSTLQMINRDLLETNNSISTGRTINTAADNAAIWSVTTVMDSDVSSFEAISDALSLGSATVTVARSAAEKVEELLTQMKDLIITGQSDNLDRNTIQADIDELKNQVDSIVNSAQFNGLNLLDGSANEIDIISSLDRSADGVSASFITVEGTNLSGGAAAVAGALGATNSADIVTTDSTIVAATAVTTSFAGFAIGGSGSGQSEIQIFITDEDSNKTLFGSVTVDDQATDDARATAIASYINSRDGVIGAEVNTVGEVDIFNKDAYFENLTIELVSVGGDTTVGAAATTNANIDTLAISNSDSEDGFIDFGTAAWADTEVINYSFTNGAGETISNTFTVATGTHGTTVDSQGQALANALASAAVASSVSFASDLAFVYDATADQIDVNYTGGEDLTITLTTNTTTANAEIGYDAGTTDNTKDVAVSAAGGTGTVVANAAQLRLEKEVALVAGEGFRVSFNKDLNGDGFLDADERIDFDYVVQANDTHIEVMEGLEALIKADARMDDVYVDAIFDANPNTLANDTFAALRVDSEDEDMVVAFAGFRGGTTGGGLGKLASLDVTTSSSAAQALNDIDEMIDTVINAAASFGSSEMRIQAQTDFISSLIDSFNTGIGALVDTDMESAAARLTALQTQQQLGTQSLAIANATPQTILTLFG